MTFVIFRLRDRRTLKPRLKFILKILFFFQFKTERSKIRVLYPFKDRVHCFLMQVGINKCLLLNPEKNLTQICLVVLEKNASLNPKNDVTEPKVRLL